MTTKLNLRARPCLESLESRELLDAGGLTHLTAPIVPAAHLSTLTPAPLQVIHANPTAPTQSVRAPGAGFDETILYSAVTLRNTTNATIAYSFYWPGAGWKSYTLGPHQSRVHYIDSANLTAQISYDRSFAAGYQDQRYNLPSENFVGGGFAGLTPQVGNGSVYSFYYTQNHSGVQLYRNS